MPPKEVEAEAVKLPVTARYPDNVALVPEALVERRVVRVDDGLRTAVDEASP